MSADRPAENAAPAAHSQAVEAVAKQLQVDLRSGLSNGEASKRLAEHGANELSAAESKTFVRRVLEQLRSAIVLILLAAVAVSIVLGDWVEAGVILAIVVLNAFVGALQEARAESALESLQAMAAPEAQVLRDGQVARIAARDVVVGDIVHLEAGSMVPADLRLIESSRLRIDESSLTGESVPVSKTANALVEASAVIGDRPNCAFSSTTIAHGRARGVVVATGSATELGKIAQEVQRDEQEATPLQRKLDEFGRLMGLAVLAVCALVFVVGFFRNPEAHILFRDGLRAYLSAARETLSGLFIVAIGLAVAAVPEGLPAVVTMSLALGTRDMLKRNALVRRLPSVETLGATTVICTDKTGTLTQNRMTVTGLHTLDTEYVASPTSDVGWRFTLKGEVADLSEHHVLRWAMTAAMLCNDAERAPGESSGFVGDPTEGALLLAAEMAGLDPKDAYPGRETEIPFDSERKRMTVIHPAIQQMNLDGSDLPWVAWVKGSPDGVIPLCSSSETEDGAAALSGEDTARILDVNSTLGERGLRVLALAYRRLADVEQEPAAEDVEAELTFLGLVAMQDPPRPEVAEAVETARTAGLRTVMITGDHAATATAIADQIGILTPHGQAITGAELDAMDDETLQREIGGIDVFARVSPQHKVRIVEALKANGDVVAMTGDGVNDAPALKRADVGIAMGITGTDVAKQTADIVLADDNYATIVAAVEKGRVIYANIRKTVFYLLSCNVAEIAILFGATLLGWPPPLTAIQLLWLNLATDGAPALALALEKAEPGIMDRPPRATGEAIVNGQMARGILFHASTLTAAVLVAFALVLRGSRPELAGSVAFATLAIAELLRAYGARSERTPLVTVGMLSNRWMQVAVLASLGLVLAVLYIPFLRPLFGVETIGLGWWGVIAGLAAVPLLLIEVRKGLRSRTRRSGA